MPAAADLSCADHDAVILAASTRVEFVVTFTASSIIDVVGLNRRITVIATSGSGSRCDTVAGAQERRVYSIQDEFIVSIKEKDRGSKY